MMRGFEGRDSELTGKVITAAIEVHKVLGAGYLEHLYENALVVEFKKSGIAFERQKIIPVTYKSHTIGESRLDFLIEKTLILELKAVANLTPLHHAQVLSYLKATNLQVGLLINFNVVLLKQGIKRIINN